MKIISQNSPQVEIAVDNASKVPAGRSQSPSSV